MLKGGDHNVPRVDQHGYCAIGYETPIIEAFREKTGTDPFEIPNADDAWTRFRAAYGTDHDPHDRLGRFYLAAVLLFEKLLFFKPGEPRTQWAVATLKEILKGLGPGA